MMGRKYDNTDKIIHVNDNNGGAGRLTLNFLAAFSLLCCDDFLMTSSRELMKTRAALSCESVSTHRRSSRFTWSRDVTMPQSVGGAINS